MPCLPYDLIRSGRRTLSLTIGADGKLIARAPQCMPIRSIEAFIIQKQHWILEKQRLFAEKTRIVSSLQLQEGACLPFANASLTLRMADVPFAFAYHGTLLLPANEPPAASVASWLRIQAELLLTPLISVHAQAMGHFPSAVRFSTARTRWGSMSSQGTLRLNTVLVLCPRIVAEYVVIHELAHIAHPNHSASFWAFVQHQMPDYRIYRTWLKQHNYLTTLLHSSP